MTEVVLVISIDTECDKGDNWINQKPLKFESVINGIPNILQPIFDQHGIKPTYLLSPEIIDSDECIATLSKIKNCELGTHLHCEFIEPIADYNSDTTLQVQKQYPYEIERQKLVNLTNLFHLKFGYKPQSFRAGRWGMSNNTLPILQSLGYLVDSSTLPCTIQKFQPDLENNFWGVPIQPYFPNLKSYKKQGKKGILEVPMTSINPLFINYPNRILRSNIFVTIFQKFLKKNSNKTLILRPFRYNVNQLKELTELMVRKYKNKNPIFLTMMFHSNEIIINGSPYVKNETDLAYFTKSLDQYLVYLKNNYNLISCGLSETIKYFNNTN